MLERIRGFIRSKPEELTYWEREISDTYQILKYQQDCARKAANSNGEDRERNIRDLLTRINNLQSAVLPRAAAQRSIPKESQHIPVRSFGDLFYWPFGNKLQRADSISIPAYPYAVPIDETIRNVDDSWVLDQSLMDKVALSLIGLLPAKSSKRILKAGEGVNR